MTVVTRNEKGEAIGFDDEAKAAMHLVEDLINAGDLVLAPDEFIGGRMMFRQSRVMRTGLACDKE